MVESLQNKIDELYTKLNTWENRYYLARTELADLLREIICEIEKLHRRIDELEEKIEEIEMIVKEVDSDGS